MYSRFIRERLSPLLQNMFLNTQQIMWYQHDERPAYFLLIIKNELHEIFPNR